MSKSLSMTPAAVRARARRAAKASPAVEAVTGQAVVTGDAQVENAPSNPSVFAALAASLTAEESEAAEEQAIAALSKAKQKSATPSVKPVDTTRYTVGAYKGRAGAMYEFMKRAGQLVDQYPAGYTRKQFVESCAKNAPHAAVTTRAQVLDYFAWAVRHGLLVEDATPVVALIVKSNGSKRAPQSRASKKISKLLVG